MKISQNYEVCDVKSLSELSSGANDLKNICKGLLEQEDDIRASVLEAQQNFNTANYDKVYAAIDDFKKRVSNFELEVDELIASVKEYAEDKENRWS